LIGHPSRSSWGDVSFRGSGNQVVPQLKRKVVEEAFDSYIKNSAGQHPGKRLDLKPERMRVSSFHKRRRQGRKPMRRGRKGYATQPSTFQKDSVAVYRKKGRRGGKRGNRRVKKFNARVKHVIDSQLGLKQVTFQNNGVLNSVANAQAFTHFMLGTTNGTGGAPSMVNDLVRVLNAVDYDSTAVSTFQNTLILNKQIGELTLSSSDLNTTDLYVTLWEIVCRIEVPAGDVDPTAVFVAGLAQNMQPVTGGSPLVASDRTTSIFMSSEFCSHFLIKGSRRITLHPGQETVITMTNKKRYSRKFSQIADTLALPGVSTGYFIQMYGAIDSTTGFRAACSLQWEFLRQYDCRHNMVSANSATMLP